MDVSVWAYAHIIAMGGDARYELVRTAGGAKEHINLNTVEERAMAAMYRGKRSVSTLENRR